MAKGGIFGFELLEGNVSTSAPYLSRSLIFHPYFNPKQPTLSQVQRMLMADLVDVERQSVGHPTISIRPAQHAPHLPDEAFY